MPKYSQGLPFAANRAHVYRDRTFVPAPAGPDPVPVDELPCRSTPGTFEIVRGDGGGFLLRLVDGNGMVLALSRTYPDITAAVKGVEAVREGAATSHISDQTARPPVPTRS
ncbi:hypothetical protein AHiyo6_26090, partial [Arthrobacter sp. Hiyo6]